MNERTETTISIIALLVALTTPTWSAEHMTAQQLHDAIVAGVTDFSGKDLSGDDLTGFDLSGLTMHCVKLVGTNLTRVKLINTDLRCPITEETHD